MVGEIYEHELSAAQVAVPNSGEPTHLLVIKAEKSLRKSKKDERKLVRPNGKARLNIWVAPENVDRAIRIYDALANAIEQRGWKVGVEVHEKPVRDGWTGYDGTHYPPVVHVENHTFVELFGERVRIALTEKSAQKMRVLTEQEAKQKRFLYIGDPKEYWYEPTGVFTLRVLNSRLHRSAWTDGKTRTVEAVLNSFLRAIIDAAVDLSSSKLEAETARIRREEESRREAQRQELLRKEQVRVKRLETDLQNWSAANRIRDYIAAVKKAAGEINVPTEAGTEVGDWIIWATKVAERQDPLTDKLPEYTITGYW